MSDDTIYRQAAIDALNRHLDTIRVTNNSTTEMIRRSEVMDCREIINGLPSAQPEIIRCKDCKYWMRAYLSISGKHGCNVMRDYTAPDDYCFKAERKA